MQFFEGTTTPADLIMTTGKDGGSITNRGFYRFPVGHDLHLASECDICNGSEAVARLVENNEGICEDCRKEAVQDGVRFKVLT